MARHEADLETALAPEGVVGALIDFSERRTQIWPYLSKDLYQVLDVGTSTARVREGTSGPLAVWAVEAYDWSESNVVRWKVEDSSAFASGTELVVRVAPRDGGGSRVHVVWERAGKTLKGKFIVGLISMLRGKPIFNSYKKVFDSLAG